MHIPGDEERKAVSQTNFPAGMAQPIADKFVIASLNDPKRPPKPIKLTNLLYPS